MDKYTLDFYCPAKKLCIEVDGEQHMQTIEQDKNRDSDLRALGIEVIRIPSLDLFETHQPAINAWFRIIEEALQSS